jgi:hypothetical protein
VSRQESHKDQGPFAPTESLQERMRSYTSEFHGRRKQIRWGVLLRRSTGISERSPQGSTFSNPSVRTPLAKLGEFDLYS